MERNSGDDRRAGNRLLSQLSDASSEHSKYSSHHKLISKFPNLQMNKTFHWFRKIAFAEGVSFLVLLFIAMPLKYFAGFPMAVTIVGSIHGALFVAFMVLAFLVREKYNKSLGWGFKAFIASIVPFGTFYMDKQWRRESAIVNRQ